MTDRQTDWPNRITVATIGGALGLFYVGSDNGLRWRTQNANGSWSNEQDLGGVVTSDVTAAAAAGGGGLELFYVGSDNGLRWRTQNANGSWSNEQDLGGFVTSDVTAAAAAGGGGLELFYVGSDNGLRWRTQNANGSWSNEQDLGGVVTSDVTAAAAAGGGGLELFYVGSDNGLRWRTQNANGSWSNEQDLGGVVTSNVAATVLPGTNTMQLFYRGPENNVVTLYRTGNGRWTKAKSLGGTLTSDITVTVVPNSRVVQLFYRGTDNGLWSKYRREDGSWSDDQDLRGNLTSDVAVHTSDSPATLQIFYRRQGNGLWTRHRQADGTWSTEVNIGPITNVFVLMLENRSFDHMLGQSGIPNITKAPPGARNLYYGQPYPVDSGAHPRIFFGPEHGFDDVVRQLCGEGAVYPPDGPYPAIDNSGFVWNYAAAIGEERPDPSILEEVMRGFDTASQLPALYRLATEFSVCDHWYSSMPGSTWPNRMFVHAASSNGLDHTPTVPEMIEYYTVDGFSFPNGTVFDALDECRLSWRIYNDKENAYSRDPDTTFVGSLPQVGALKRIQAATEVHSLQNFASDLKGPYPYQYTFIEPNYGYEPTKGPTTNFGGSSQHPIDDVFGGEALIAAVYRAIRQSPLWPTSMLIITYDEHGGFYDSVAPPPAPAPDDNSSNTLNSSGFDFRQYGVRVPAIVVSPLIPASTVNHDRFDHSSVSATLRALFGTRALTNRDGNANDLIRLLREHAARLDTPVSVPIPEPAGRAHPATLDNDDPIPSNDNTHGFLTVALKTRLELGDDDEAVRQAHIQEALAVRSVGDAHAYLRATHAMIAAANCLAGAIDPVGHTGTAGSTVKPTPPNQPLRHRSR